MEPSRLSQGLWWAAGTTVCMFPTCGAIWYPQDGPELWVVLLVGAVFAALYGPIWAQRQPWCDRDRDGRRISPALLVATIYPISLGLCVAILTWDPYEIGELPEVLAFWAGLALIAPVLFFALPRPRRAMLVGAICWDLVTVLLMGTLLFVIALPLVVSYHLVAMVAPSYRWSPVHAAPRRVAVAERRESGR